MDGPRTAPTYLLNDVQTGIEGAIGMFEALRRRAKGGGSYLVRVSLSRSCHRKHQTLLNIGLEAPFGSPLKRGPS
jgi:hypothetical protein